MSEMRKLVGEVVVNSGQLLIADPAVVQNLWGQDTYDTIVGVTGSDARGGEVMDGHSYAFNAGLGDGLYNVYATKNDDGDVIKVEIMKSSDPWYQDEDEDDDDFDDSVPDDEYDVE